VNDHIRVYKRNIVGLFTFVGHEFFSTNINAVEFKHDFACTRRAFTFLSSNVPAKWFQMSHVMRNVAVNNAALPHCLIRFFTFRFNILWPMLRLLACCIMHMPRIHLFATVLQIVV